VRVSHYADSPLLPFPELRGSAEPRPDDKPFTFYKPVFKGKPGSQGNFEMAVYSYEARKVYPRHHHDFDQIRYTLAGVSPWAPGQAAPEGDVVYFPAGTYYGPYERDKGLEILFIQFQGAGCPTFVDYDSLQVAHDELAKKGTFEKGVYTWLDEQGGKHNMDGHQAAIEWVRGHSEEFPPQRFSDPIEMHPANFNWVDAVPGVQTKQLGVFTEGRTTLSLLKLAGAATYTLAPEQRTLLFAIEGAGRAGDEAIAERDGVMLEPGESGTLSTSGELELFVLALPKEHTIR
jgi:hypothetical protein